MSRNYGLLLVTVNNDPETASCESAPCGLQSSHLAPSRCSPTEPFSNEITDDRSWIVAKRSVRHKQIGWLATRSGFRHGGA